MTTAQHPRLPIPLDVFHCIISYVPASDSTTLVTCLRLSKECCHAVAPKLYRNVHITPETDLLVDTGLPSDLLAPFRQRDTDINKVVMSENSEAEGGRKEGKEQGPEGEHKTLKGRFLGLIRTLDIHRRASPAHRPRMKVRVLAHDNGEESEEEMTPEPPLVHHPFSLKSLNLHIDQVRFRLDTNRHSRPSPFDTPLCEPDLNSFLEPLLGMIRCPRLVFHGASFTMSAPVLKKILPSFIKQLKEIFIVITPGALPTPADPMTGYHGLYRIYDNLVEGHLKYSGMYETVNIFFVLQTPNDSARFQTIIFPDPVSGLWSDMNVDEGYIDRMISNLITRIAENWRKFWKAGRRSVSLVNFDALDGGEVGMPGCTRGEMEDLVKSWLDGFVRPERSDEVLRADWKKDIKIVGLEEWWQEDHSREQVLDEEIVAGWKGS